MTRFLGQDHASQVPLWSGRHSLNHPSNARHVVIEFLLYANLYLVYQRLATHSCPTWSRHLARRVCHDSIVWRSTPTEFETLDHVHEMSAIHSNKNYQRHCQCILWCMSIAAIVIARQYHTHCSRQYVAISSLALLLGRRVFELDSLWCMITLQWEYTIKEWMVLQHYLHSLIVYKLLMSASGSILVCMPDASSWPPPVPPQLVANSQEIYDTSIPRPTVVIRDEWMSLVLLLLRQKMTISKDRSTK